MRRLMLGLMIACAAPLVLAWITPDRLDRTVTPPPLLWLASAARTVQLQIASLLGACTIFALVVDRRHVRRHAAPRALILLMCTVACPALGQIWWTRDRPHSIAAAPRAVTIRVMTANVHKDNVDTCSILASVRAADPDVLLLQEYTPLHDYELNPALPTMYPYFRTYPRNDNDGMALFSRLPILSSDPPEQGPTARTRVMRASLALSNGEVLCVYNVHLKSPRTPKRLMLNRRQTLMLVDRLRRDSPDQRLIVAGDFNFSRATPQHDALRAIGLIDVPLTRGRATWPDVGWPGRLLGADIDHIFVSGNIGSSVARLGEATGSDHAPVVADVSIPAADE